MSLLTQARQWHRTRWMKGISDEEIFGGALGLHEGAEKVLAFSHYPGVVVAGYVARADGRIGRRTIHLHTLLKALCTY